MTASLQAWALPKLQHLLPLDEDSLKQIITYSDTLPKDAASEHLKNLLGDSAQALEFISSFNQRRPTPPSEARTVPSASQAASTSEVPRVQRHPKKQKQPFNKLPPPRQVEEHGSMPGAYLKKDQDDYIASKSKARQPKLANTLALQPDPDAEQNPTPTGPLPTILDDKPSKPPKPPPSAAGPLIGDSPRGSRSSSPAPKTKVNLTGGTSMRGASTALSDLDSAIRALEVQTNPSLLAASSTAEETARRRCTCQAQRHALLAAAPNCLSCGKIICAKEGLGPCTFCGTPLLSREEIGEMVRVLKEERGRERMDAHNASHRRADISKAPRPFSGASTPGSGSDAEPDTTLLNARAHRDRLLKYQADNARRTRVHDEAADYETPDAGTSMWASPQERALQLKRQQRVLREQEWNARPEFEKRRVVVSLDVKGGKAVRRMQEISRDEALGGPDMGEDDDNEIDAGVSVEQTAGAGGERRGGFAKNPLLGELIRPVYRSAEESKGKQRARERGSTWRRVQDDMDDNGEIILDGGAYGDMIDGRVLAAEELAHG